MAGLSNPLRRVRRARWPVRGLLVRTLVPAAYGAALLGGLYTVESLLEPGALGLLLVFIVHFLWRIHALVVQPSVSDLERVEVGLLAMLALSTLLEILAPEPIWCLSAYGVLLVALATGISVPGLLVLPLAAVALVRSGVGWVPGLLHLELLAAAAGGASLFRRRRQRRLEVALDKLRLDTENLQQQDASTSSLRGDLSRLDDVLYDYLAEVKGNAEAHAAVLALKTPKGGLYVRELVSESPNLREEALLDLQGTTFQWILENAKPLRIGHLRDPASRLGYYAGSVGVKSFLGVPLLEGEEVEGVLGVDSLQENAFSDAHQTVLKVASHQVSTILRQIQALERVKREARDFKLLHEFSKRLATCDSVADLLDLVLASLRERLQPDLSAAILLDGEGSLRVERAGEPRWEDLQGRTFATEEGLAGWVVSSKQYLHYGEGRERARRPLLGRGVSLPEFPTLLLQPLVAHGDALGLLCLAAAAPRAFDGSAVAFTEVLAQQTAQSILQLRSLEQLKALATTDGLTGLANRRVFFDRMAEEFRRSDRYEQPLSLLLLDVDHFKKVNDRFGHPAGDRVLREVAAALGRLARETDLVARYGGEEFAVLLPSTDEKGARILAERARSGVEALAVEWEDKTIPVRISVGVASREGGATVDDLVSWADHALYAAKQGGRNRVVPFSEIREYVSWGTAPSG